MKRPAGFSSGPFCLSTDITPRWGADLELLILNDLSGHHLASEDLNEINA